MASKQTQDIGARVGAVLGALGGGMVGKVFGGKFGAVVGAIAGGGIGYAVAKPPVQAEEFEDEWEMQGAAANPEQLRDNLL